MEGYSYLSLITDAYSRKIVGYALHPSLGSEGCMIALSMALDGRISLNSPLVHHSDRGVQYCCGSYVDLLSAKNIAISMTQSGNPYENALAERMNGIIKSEFFPKKIFQNHKEAKKVIDKIIQVYNGRRPHSSLNFLTPNAAHQMTGPIAKKWKPRKRKFRNSDPQNYNGNN